MPVPTPALLTLQHHAVLTLHFIWVPKAVALLTEQTASENTALLTSRHQSKVNKYGRYPNTAIRRRFLSALFRSRPRYRRNKTCVHGRSIAPSVSTSCLVRKARRETGRSSGRVVRMVDFRVVCAMSGKHHTAMLGRHIFHPAVE